MLASMEPDPIAGFMHVTNIVIIPSGLRKWRALEWLQIMSRNNRASGHSYVDLWMGGRQCLPSEADVHIYNYLLADQHVVWLYLA